MGKRIEGIECVVAQGCHIVGDVFDPGIGGEGAEQHIVLIDPPKRRQRNGRIEVEQGFEQLGTRFAADFGFGSQVADAKRLRL